MVPVSFRSNTGRSQCMMYAAMALIVEILRRDQRVARFRPMRFRPCDRHACYPRPNQTTAGHLASSAFETFVLAVQFVHQAKRLRDASKTSRAPATTVTVAVPCPMIDVRNCERNVFTVDTENPRPRDCRSQAFHQPCCRVLPGRQRVNSHSISLRGPDPGG